MRATSSDSRCRKSHLIESLVKQPATLLCGGLFKLTAKQIVAKITTRFGSSKQLTLLPNAVWQNCSRDWNVLNFSSTTDSPWETITARAVHLFETLSAHPHYHAYYIEVDGEQRLAHSLHSMPQAAAIADTMAIRLHGSSTFTRIDQLPEETELHLQFVDAIDRCLQQAAIPVQQQWN